LKNRLLLARRHTDKKTPKMSSDSLESDALALLALKSSNNNASAATTTPPTTTITGPPPTTNHQNINKKSMINLDTPPIARLETRDFEYLIRTRKVTIGRNSSSGTVDVSMGNSSFISRRHIEIRYEHNNFWLSCLGKNGVFIDGTFYRKGPLQKPLERKCTFRFPSTNFRVWFESLVDDEDENMAEDMMMMEDIEEDVDREVAEISRGGNRNPQRQLKQQQLKINIPDRQQGIIHDFPSPTGTIRLLHNYTIIIKLHSRTSRTITIPKTLINIPLSSRTASRTVVLRLRAPPPPTTDHWVATRAAGGDLPLTSSSRSTGPQTLWPPLPPLPLTTTTSRYTCIRDITFSIQADTIINRALRTLHQHTMAHSRLQIMRAVAAVKTQPSQNMRP
jgi:pSer/pThr/pTyr-binding forkhead associated (FHA) protein